MRRLFLIPAIIAVAAVALSATEASADRLRLATSGNPAGIHVASRALLGTRPLGSRMSVATRVLPSASTSRGTRGMRFRARIARTASYGCRPEHIPYAYPPTGYTPLPYEFGPWCAAIVARY